MPRVDFAFDRNSYDADLDANNVMSMWRRRATTQSASQPSLFAKLGRQASF